MNEDTLKGKWHQIKGEVKSRWGQLTDDDLDRVEGDAEKLIGRVQERYGFARDDAKREVDAFIQRHRDLPYRRRPQTAFTASRQGPRLNAVFRRFAAAAAKSR